MSFDNQSREDLEKTQEIIEQRIYELTRSNPSISDRITSWKLYPILGLTIVVKATI